MTFWRTALFLIVVTAPVLAQWDVGVVAGYGFRRSIDVRQQGGTSASLEFARGPAWGVYVGEDKTDHLGGEVHYLYERTPLKLSSGSTETSFAGHTHVFHFNMLFYGTRRTAAIRPFVAVGAGIKLYSGTGPDNANQPLSRFVLLTRRNEIKPVLSPGAGVKFHIGQRVSARLEGRYYLGPTPEDIIVAAPGASVKGWTHDFVPLIGVGLTF
jgi:opacity protein-like surface antigen